MQRSAISETRRRRFTTDGLRGQTAQMNFGVDERGREGKEKGFNTKGTKKHEGRTHQGKDLLGEEGWRGDRRGG